VASANKLLKKANTRPIVAFAAGGGVSQHGSHQFSGKAVVELVDESGADDVTRPSVRDM
jgi:hypothetical protein